MVYGNAVVIDGAELTSTAVIDGGELCMSDQIEDGVQNFMPVFPPGYEGETVITPSEETQVLDTAGLVVATNITVNPIPSNYGRILWDGSVLTVY